MLIFLNILNKYLTFHRNLIWTLHLLHNFVQLNIQMKFYITIQSLCVNILIKLQTKSQHNVLIMSSIPHTLYFFYPGVSRWCMYVSQLVGENYSFHCWLVVIYFTIHQDVSFRSIYFDTLSDRSLPTGSEKSSENYGVNAMSI